MPGVSATRKCVEKTAAGNVFDDLGEAWARVEAWRARSGRPMREETVAPYVCPCCGRFHLGDYRQARLWAARQRARASDAGRRSDAAAIARG